VPVPTHRLRLLPSCLILVTAGWLFGCLLLPGREASVGAEEALRVEQTLGLLEGTPQNTLVAAIGRKLAGASGRPDGPWQFHIVDSPDANAFALPGGYVYVTRGLLALVNSEDELAGVIGHEIGHVTGRHSAGRMTLAAPFAIVSGVTRFAVGIVSPLLGDVIAGTGEALVGGLVIAPFSREQEHRADATGQELVARAGYDPSALSSFLTTLSREAQLHVDQERRFHFLDTHPMTPERAERTRRRGTELPREQSTPLTRNRADFLERLAGLVVGADPARGIFEENRFLHPELDFTLTFPTGWKTKNTSDAVGAASPDEDALLVVQLLTVERVEELVEKLRAQDPTLEIERLTVGGLPAAHTRFDTRSRGQRQTIDVHWIEHRGVYQLVGTSVSEESGAQSVAFRKAAHSFRPLSGEERGQIRESRLRIVEAKPGETPEEIAGRSGTSWSAAELAVANAIPQGRSLAGGEPLKLAIPQPYTPRGVTP